MLFTGFNDNIPGLRIVVSEGEGENDENIDFTYDHNNLEEQYDLAFVRYVQYVRILATENKGMLFDEVEVFGFSK